MDTAKVNGLITYLEEILDGYSEPWNDSGVNQPHWLILPSVLLPALQ